MHDVDWKQFSSECSVLAKSRGVFKTLRNICDENRFSWKPLTILAKTSIIDVLQGFEYASLLKIVLLPPLIVRIASYYLFRTTQPLASFKALVYYLHKGTLMEVWKFYYVFGSI